MKPALSCGGGDGGALGQGAGAKRPDLLIGDHLFPPVVIKRSFNGRDADRDAQDRLRPALRSGSVFEFAIRVAIRNKFRHGGFLQTAEHQVSRATLEVSLFRHSQGS